MPFLRLWLLTAIAVRGEVAPFIIGRVASKGIAARRGENVLMGRIVGLAREGCGRRGFGTHRFLAFAKICGTGCLRAREVLAALASGSTSLPVRSSASLCEEESGGNGLAHV